MSTNSTDIDLCALLEDCVGVELYSPIWGVCTLNAIYKDNNNGSQPLVNVRLSNGSTRNVTRTGHLSYDVEHIGEVILWPSKNDRDWRSWYTTTISVIPEKVLTEKDILIKRCKGHFVVFQNTKNSGFLSYDEMLGLVSALTLSESRPQTSWMKTADEHKAWLDDIIKQANEDFNN